MRIIIVTDKNGVITSVLTDHPKHETDVEVYDESKNAGLTENLEEDESLHEVY